MQCEIYKSIRKEELYVYVAEGHKAEELPKEVLDGVGLLTKVMDLELSADRKLAREDVNTVMAALRDKGFFVQMPPPDPQLVENVLRRELK
ncbi:MAG: YcgL domain-containing protein [Gammaproteobacteria bacterium]